jgi:hypothetical protein
MAAIHPLTGLSSVELVQRTITGEENFKAVAIEFESRPPDLAAAQRLVEAYREGRAAPWLTALLLGRLRASEGYPVTREILLAAPGQLAESYAGPAMARIRGEAAREDLLGIVMNEAPKRSREGAAYGMALLRGPGVADEILAAFRAGRIGV